MHQTNKAFERYFRVGADDVREIYRETVIQYSKIKVDKNN